MSEIEYALSAKDVHVKYRSMNSFSIKRKAGSKTKRRDAYEALRGINFDIEKGKIVGVVGKNGSGKSTLLKTIAGVFSPDKGEITCYGKQVSLLAIGIGFQSSLTGYENIFLSGLLLGFDEKTIKSRLQEIIDFSELGDFIYKPVRTYSSGMHSKLAFAITAILDTDIMLIDEVLSVGDINFKEKSFNKMKEIISDKDKTVIIVSHSMSSLRELCDDVMWIDEGKVREYGEADTIIKHYVKYMREEREKNAKKE